MNAAIAALAAFAVYFLAYRVYARYLGSRIFELDPDRKTPAHYLRDEVDYVPTKPAVLFGHHYASITGLAPMLGPAVAVIWGWLPALLWVVVGAVLVGCVHDFSALVLSVRARGLSIGKVAEGVIGARARSLFHFIIFFGVSLAMGVFVFVISHLFAIELAPGHAGYPQSVLPSGLLMLIAMAAGFLLYRRGMALAPVTLVAFLLTLAGVYLGHCFPTIGFSAHAWPSPSSWTLILLGYAGIASVLPVWALLQSRDFLNSLLLYLGLGLAYVGLLIGAPSFDAPAVVAEPEGAPPLLPFVFIVIACGAASGFHGLVSSGTTAKQLDREPHARPIAYGGMIGESLLGLLATLACTAGFASEDLWHEHYANWGQAQGLATKIDAFIQGATSFVTTLGLPADLSAALIAMVVVSFALTTLDSATRLLRFNVEEIGATFRIPGTSNRYLASALACGAIGFFAFYKIDGKPAGLALWALFGTTNQLLAGLTLLAVTLYLKQRGKNPWFTGIPMVFMLVSTLIAMVTNLHGFSNGWSFGPETPWPLFIVGSLLLILGLWLLVEAALAFQRARRDRQISSLLVLEDPPESKTEPEGPAP
jgi:carbon starvation protein